jgi:DNA-binding helix-hairpin-helix protein with protein kinase domain
MVDQYTIHLVDCDSFQVEDYPCPVGRSEFSDPVLLGRNFREFLRKRRHELFAAAALLFTLLVPGMRPYGRVGGGTVEENIAAGEFPYHPRLEGWRNVPRGPWLRCWSHLSPGLKNAFYQTFHKSTRLGKRKTLTEWLELLQAYQLRLYDDDRVYRSPLPGYDLNMLPEQLHYGVPPGTP